ncbi:MAG TPA: ribosomal protein S18-alanine N-acetyltransferase [Anaerolineales bacterium]|nr:ribosomal protein S18-alanine N-acetyltransferase [Anaerolineales bacterium]
MTTAIRIVIRRMAAVDLAEVEAIDQASFPLPWPPGSYRYELDDNPRARCWVAEIDGQVAGALVGWLILDEYQVATFAVRAEARRRGVGRALLGQAITAAEAEGAERFTLEVRAGNTAAQALYRGFGFTITGISPARYADGEDAILMERRN